MTAFSSHTGYLKKLLEELILKRVPLFQQQEPMQDTYQAKAMDLLPDGVDKLRQDSEPLRQAKRAEPGLLEKYAVSSNSLPSVNFNTQISKRALLGLKTPQYIAKLCFNICDTASIFPTDKKTYNLQKPAFFSNLEKPGYRREFTFIPGKFSGFPSCSHFLRT